MADKVSLRDYVDRVFEETNLRNQQRFEAQEERLGVLNNLRAEVIEDRGDFVRRDVLDATVKPLLDRIDLVEKRHDRLLGIGLILVPLAGVVGGAITKVLGG